MLIIGEKINATRKSVNAALLARDAGFVQELALKQARAGSHLLDVNCGTVAAAAEPDAMQWLVRTVQQATDLPLCIDSPNPEALAAGLAVHAGRPMINSISGENARYEKVLPLVTQTQATVIALCMDDRGIPAGQGQALEVGVALVERLMSDGIAVERIYLDPLVRTLSTQSDAVIDTLRLMTALGERFPGLHFVSGLSNVSYGLPERRHLNRAFIVMSIAHGLDAVIADPLDADLQALVYAAEALVNKDRFCLNYIKAYQEGRLASR
jgi:5-methyltetrahydrofolate--homocysteine methyltransferase